ncbi:hypothetical protein KIN20_025498 [Parelaphostrongylus tenuis]|uniref:Uncharacterized protein n=1 Tax=Parelaphostrongylus tenuis TaxID=148309 RepID=A0AAD5NBX1_PARTN|nr:hypothetical protein KIN20_025498 [Parelaphostrongylus tenuis]
MANWSRMMWRSVVDRAVRMLASGPFGLHFVSAHATMQICQCLPTTNQFRTRKAHYSSIQIYLPVFLTQRTDVSKLLVQPVIQ